MKSSSPDRSRSASDFPRISGRDPSTHETHLANAMPAQSCCHTALTVVSKSLPQGESIDRASCYFCQTTNLGIPTFKVTPTGDKQGLRSSEPELRNLPGKTKPGSHGQFASTLQRSPCQPQRSSWPTMVSIGHLIGRKKPLICQKWRQVKAVRAIWQTPPLKRRVNEPGPSR